jgi:hypothetical protein
VAKKTSVMDDMIEGVKSAAETVGQIAGEAVGTEPQKKVYERIVPIPEVKIRHPSTGLAGTAASASKAPRNTAGARSAGK